MTGPGLVRRRAGAAAALVGALIVTGLASPAGAEAVITVTGPAEGAVLDRSTVSITGRIEVGALSTIKEAVLTLGDARFDARCTQSPCGFTWAPSLPRNGRYEVTVAAVEQTLVVEGPRTTLTRKFVVDAPPAKPVLDAPKVTEGRTVELSWSRNTEPDMLFYAVFRKDPGGTAFTPVGTVKQPESGAAVSFTDATTTLNGGDFAYQVVAVRKGGTKPETASAPSAVRTAVVPVPPTTTTLAPAPGAPAAGATTTTVKAGAAAGTDLSGFLAARSQVAPTRPPTILEPPDTGFEGDLPFGAVPPGQDLEEGEAEAVVPNTDRSTASIVSLEDGRPLVPVAAGLVLLLLALHLRVLNRRLRPVGGGDLPIEAPAPAAGAPAGAPAPAPTPGPAAPTSAAPSEARHARRAVSIAAPVAGAGREWQREPEPEVPELEPELATEAAGGTPAFYDVADDDDWDAGWAPHAGTDVEPEIEPEPRLRAPAPDPEQVEVFDVIAPERRALARSGAR